jgi:hypothetical protein
MVGSSAQREQAVRIDFFEQHGYFGGGRGNHARKKETRKFVGYDYRGARGKCGEQPFARRALDVRIIKYARSLRDVRIYGHSVDDKPVDFVAGPGKIRSQGL